MSSAAGPRADPTPPDDRSVGELVFDVSERVSTLIREEIELAKTEIREKVTKLVQGSVVGIAAGVFALMGLAMLMHGIAWLLNDLFFEATSGSASWSRPLFWFVRRGGRRILRLPLRAGGRTADAGPGDRGGAADQGDARGRHPVNGTTGHLRERRRRAGAVALHRARPGAAPSRSAPTSSASAPSSAARSRRCAAASPSSPTGAARSASTARAGDRRRGGRLRVGGLFALRRR